MRHLLALLLIAANAFAVPQLINYQGQLATGINSTPDTTVAMTFTIYNASESGTSLWTETHPAVVVNGGLFKVALGSQTTLPDVFSGNCWIGVTVGEDTEMTPREQITTSAHAYRVGTVDGATGGHVSSNVSIGTGTTAGGQSTFAAGENNSASAGFSNISGGKLNRTTGLASTVGGGPALIDSNYAGSQGSTVGGGTSNNAAGFFATVAGGCGNTSTNQFCTVAGGLTNNATNLHATVGGGYNNQATGEKSIIGGGTENDAVGGFSTITGGKNNYASGINSTIGGGQNNFARGLNSTVGGGGGLAAIDSNSAGSQGSTVGGGSSNNASGFFGTVAGGCGNTSTNQFCTVAGGLTNNATNLHATVGGGYNNQATGDKSTVSGGSENTASGLHSVIPGGTHNHADGDFSLVAGRNSLTPIGMPGCLVWGASSTGALTQSFAAYTATFRCQNGARFYTDSSNTVTGVTLGQGAGAWSSLCDVNQKNLYGSVDSRSILDKVSSLPLYRWSYKTQDESVQHIGPTAQDFSAAFGLGENNTTICTLDPDGVALAAIQELAKRNATLEAEVAELRSAILELQSK